MLEQNQVFKCSVCGNIIQVVSVGGGTLTCCGKAMNLLTENTVDAAVEKHVPVVEQNGNKVLVKVGSVSHPMEEKHYIQWIQVITKNKIYTKMLNPGDSPEAEFSIDDEIIKVREYCNLHGLWTK